MGPRVLRRLASLLAVPVLVAGMLFTTPSPAMAASGGRIGGGSFRSSPAPRSSGGSYRGGGGGGRTYGGGYYGSPYGGGGYYRGGYGGGYYGGGYYGGGGIGIPFVVPMFGFGGGLLGFLVLMAVVGVLLNAFRGMTSSSTLSGSDGDVLSSSGIDGAVSVVQVQVGLLASARELQQDLRRMASTADTSSSAGLQRVLQETSLSLLRNPDLWVYANTEEGQIPFSSAEATFNRLTMRERSKLERELTANVAGKRYGEPAGTTTTLVGQSDATSDYIAVTLLLACRRRLQLKGSDTAEHLRESLQQLGSVGADDLLALEVIWQPEGAGEVLTSEQLLTAYPDLQHL